MKADIISTLCWYINRRILKQFHKVHAITGYYLAIRRYMPTMFAPTTYNAISIIYDGYLYIYTHFNYRNMDLIEFIPCNLIVISYDKMALYDTHTDNRVIWYNINELTIKFFTNYNKNNIISKLLNGPIKYYLSFFDNLADNDGDYRYTRLYLCTNNIWNQILLIWDRKQPAIFLNKEKLI